MNKSEYTFQGSTSGEPRPPVNSQRYPTPAHHPLVREEIGNAVTRFYGRALVVLGPQHEATPSYIKNWYAEELLSPVVADAKRVAQEIHKMLVDSPDFDWWGTHLGRACAWHIGYGHVLVPREAVAAILGVTRQWVHQLSERKKNSGMAGTFGCLEVRDLLRDRWDRIQDREMEQVAERGDVRHHSHV